MPLVGQGPQAVGVPTAEAVMEVMGSLLAQVKRRGELVQELLGAQGEAQRAGMENQANNLEAALEVAQQKTTSDLVAVWAALLTLPCCQAQKEASRDAGLENDMARQAAERDAQLARQEAQAASLKLAKLGQQKTLMEAELSALQTRLKEEAVKEQQKRAEHEALFRQLLGKASKPTSPSDTQRIDLIAMYEAQREHLEGEVRALSRQASDSHGHSNADSRRSNAE